MDNKLPDITLPVWMNKGEPLTLAHASKTWWERVREWLTFPLAQIDVDTCDEQLLALLAYQRDVERFPGESLSLFRLRVKHAFVNAQDAGSIAGFAPIFERLEIGEIQQLERQLQYEWDVILIRINDEQLSRDNTLMMRLVRQYGRTCRRYFFDVVNENSEYIYPGHFDCVTWFCHSKLSIRPSAIVPELDEVWLLPGEAKTIRVDVLPAGVEDATFTAEVDEVDYCEVAAGAEYVTLKGLDFGVSVITLKTNDGGRTATITARVVAGAKVDFTYTSSTAAVFTNTGADQFYVDWGDGVVGRNFVNFTSSGIGPDEGRLTLGENYTLTVYGSETVTFGRSSTSSANLLTRIHIFAGTRTSATSAFIRQSKITEIAETAFDYLKNVTSYSEFMEGCSGIRTLPKSFLTGETKVTTLQGAFRQSGLTSLQPGFLSQAYNLSSAYRAFGYTQLTTVEKGLMRACAGSLTNISVVFMNCTKLETDINDIFDAESYPNLKNCSQAFWNCSLMPGEGMQLVNKLPEGATTTQMFYGCSSLSDYSQVPRIAYYAEPGEEPEGE
ncbi:phage tail protein [Enterobacter mori]|uniref:phage tail protein n=1 Tax=Enterobacter mori TaxID=539813 RepID=UPI003D6EB369